MVVLLTAFLLWEARAIYHGYKFNKHWTRVLLPGFFAGVTLMMLAHILTTAYYWDTSIWWPDWTDPSFLILSPDNW